MRSVARQFGLSLSTVQHWVRRAGTQRLDRIDFATHATGPASPVNRTPAHLEDRILDLRKTLKIDSDLGEYGALAIHRELHQTQLGWIPSIRTIGRILERRGALDGVRRQRRPAPPLGWYLPEVVSGYAEVDAFDILDAGLYPESLASDRLARLRPIRQRHAMPGLAGGHHAIHMSGYQLEQTL